MEMMSLYFGFEVVEVEVVFVRLLVFLLLVLEEV